MAERKVTSTLYLDGAPADEELNPFAIRLGPAAQRATGRKTTAKRKGDTRRDLNARASSGQGGVSAPRTGYTRRAEEAVTRAIPELAPVVQGFEGLTGAAEFEDALARGIRQAARGDAYVDPTSGRRLDDRQLEDARLLAIYGGAEALPFAAKPLMAVGRGVARAGRAITPRAVREGVSDLAARARRYLTEARPLDDADYIEGSFSVLPEEMGAFAVQPQGQRQIATTYREPRALPAPPRAVPPYSDPEASVIGDWDWLPLEQVRERLGGLSAVPPHVLDFGKFMDEQALRAAAGQMTPRDLLKAFTVTRASIQRQATDAELLRRAGLQLPEDVTGKVRPEGAFGMWLGTPEGQAYLDAAQRGQLEEHAIESAVQGMSPFGKQNDLRDALTWAASNLPGREGRAAELIAAGREMASSPDEWRAFTKDIRGIGPSKSGFLASLLGRGDQPTLDARQIILNTGRPTREATRYLARRGGRGGVEGVERLAARQRALDLATPAELQPYYQHLAHHSIWDKAGDEVTTHSDVVDAMRNYKRGGLAVKRKAR